MDNAEIQSVLQTIGMRVPPASRLVLVGGSALSLLGSLRPTVDIDAEPVPLDKFIPLPQGSEGRVIRVGQFGNLEIFIADPYSIALSKLDRGADTDYDDLVFLVQHNHVDMSEFERMVQEALAHARQFDFHPDILKHLQELKTRLGRG
jgi:hypothetical protein